MLGDGHNLRRRALGLGGHRSTGSPLPERDRQTLEIYNITGVRIAAYKIDSNDTTVSLSCGKGCYILKLGKIARKVSIL